ncbi:unnamed protein product [Mytilus coruscus]|uniref:Uncharacterized protein n=1 Tax=Mytilus coruscus TaxID=42192 RepID=A0A6J8DTJ5_MYTCO|nr:unnamed protein product [Mytilus coruscus]
MERRNSATFTRQGNTRPIDDDQINMAPKCGTYSDGRDEMIKMLQIPHPTPDTTEDSNLLKNDEVTHRKSCQSGSAERSKVLSPQDDIVTSGIDTSTKLHDRLNILDDCRIDKKEPSAKKRISKRCNHLCPNTFSFVLTGLVCVGLYFYIENHISTHKPMFENLKVNFDSYNLQNTSGNIGWKLLATTFLKLDETGTNISMLQSGSYSIDVSLNFDNRRNKDQTSLSVCILNSGDNDDDPCTTEVLLARTQRSVLVGANLNLQKGDGIWVSVKGLHLVYQRSNVNHMTIRKHD